MCDIPPSLPEAEVIAFDLETRDPDLTQLGPGWAFPERGGYIVGFALAWRTPEGDPESCYLPVRHEGGGNLPMDEVRAFVAPLLADPRRTIVMANATYDYGWARAESFDWEAQIDDVQIQAPLIEDQRLSFSLGSLAKSFLGESKRENELYEAAREWGIKDVKGGLWRLPGPLVAPYGRGDAEQTLRIHEVLRPRIDELGLDRVHKLETSLVPLLYRCRLKGVRVDRERAEELSVMFRTREAEAVDSLSALGHPKIDPWIVPPIIKALEDEGVSEFPLTPKKKQKSVDADFLKLLSSHNNRAGRVAAEILKLRKYQKARSTFCENMVLEHSINGRIHSELRALRSDDGGTVSGRFSCSNPNLQQVPSKDPELGPLIRSLFLPDEGHLWGSLDYASQEPRLAVHFGVRAGISQARELADMWHANPRMDPYLPTAEICGITRKEAKTIRLGILYGMGGGKLCASLGLPTEPGVWKGRDILYAGPEGKLILEKFHTHSPMDKRLSRMAQDKATSAGEVRTVLGRRSTFPRQPNGEVWFTHKALNRVIQGSAADMTKQAMLDCDAAGLPPTLSVHDELTFSLPGEPEAARSRGLEIAEVMAAAVPLTVPVVCDVEIGTSWGDSMGKTI
jgi:DNA polymerase I-like protein with 3'-5' exonuclease and polymerase domains